MADYETKFPLEILDGITQLDKIEKKLDAILQHLGIELEDASREAVANNKELADFHGAQCRKNEFIYKIRDYLKRKEREHDNICIKVLRPWSFDVRSTNLGSNVNNKVTLLGDQRGNHFKANIVYKNGFLYEISIKRFPLLSDDTGIIANIYQCNFVESFADSIINCKIEVPDLGYSDLAKKCRSISEDFDEWWFSMCLVGETVRGEVRILKKIDLAVNGKFVASLNAVGSADLIGVTITRNSDDTADFEFDGVTKVTGVNFNKLGRFLYHCILMDELEIPCFTEWRRFKYNGPAIPK
jgi:hypothetical protein